jgi:hypothetical protein
MLIDNNYKEEEWQSYKQVRIDQSDSICIHWKIKKCKIVAIHMNLLISVKNKIIVSLIGRIESI